MGGDPHNDLKTDDSDSTDGSLFGSDSHLDNALAHSLCKGDSGAKVPEVQGKGRGQSISMERKALV